MKPQDELHAIQACITNTLNPEDVQNRRLAGVIGEFPSRYSKSPALWNGAFKLLGIDAVYLPFDVSTKRLKQFTSLLKDTTRLLGANVTVPHKVKILQYLDELDLGAARLQAVNTIVRTTGGRLIGYNTDGEGFLHSLVRAQPEQTKSFMESLKDIDVLLLGAGGSARAVAFHLADELGRGRLVICNRTLERALALAGEIRKTGHSALAITEEDLSHWAEKVQLIVNSTTKGQSGLQTIAGKVVSFEPYSSLAPAHPPPARQSDYGKADSLETDTKARADIQANNELSLRIASAVPPDVRFYDLIYSPEETVFLRHARLTGHPTMNGKAMIINQAAIAFCWRICRAELQARGLDSPDTYQRILETMYSAW